MTTINSNKAFYQLLYNNVTLCSLVTNSGVVDLYGPPGLPQNWTARRTITYLRQQTLPDDELPFFQHSFQVRSYAKSYPEAEALHNILFDTFHQQGMLYVQVQEGKVLFQRIDCTSGPIDTPVPQAKWIYALSMWQCRLGRFYV